MVTQPYDHSQEADVSFVLFFFVASWVENALRQKCWEKMCLINIADTFLNIYLFYILTEVPKTVRFTFIKFWTVRTEQLRTICRMTSEGVDGLEEWTMAVFIFMLYACTLVSRLLCAYRLNIHNIFKWIYMHLCSVIIMNVPVRIYDNTKPQDCVTSCLNKWVITVNILKFLHYFYFPLSKLGNFYWTRIWVRILPHIFRMSIRLYWSEGIR